MVGLKRSVTAIGGRLELLKNKRVHLRSTMYNGHINQGERHEQAIRKSTTERVTRRLSGR